MSIPDDADGDAIRRIIADGSDVSRPMLVDFQIACPDQAGAKAIASKIPSSEFSIRIYSDADGNNITCECSKEMLLDHSDLLRIQKQLNDIAAPLGGWSDGWGTFGNGECADKGEAPAGS